jgi:hypothetical protein
MGVRPPSNSDTEMACKLGLEKVGKPLAHRGTFKNLAVTFASRERVASDALLAVNGPLSGVQNGLS